MKSILFVCTGNICRSPMAEGLFRHLVRARPDIRIASAGLNAAPGLPPSPDAVRALRELGIEISDFRSQMVSSSLVDRADFIFGMTRAHVDILQMIFPHAAEKVFLLREFEDPGLPREVPDPIGQGYSVYLDCRDTIQQALPSILAFIDQSETPQAMTLPTNAAKPIRIAIGADHGGFELKDKLVSYLKSNGYQATDIGTHSATSVDYPDFAEPVCTKLLTNEADVGILLCRTGIGMSIAANRHPGIRASVVASETRAKETRQHNDANILCLPADSVDVASAKKIVDAFLSTPFEGGRHLRRVEKLDHPILSHNRALSQVDPEISAAIDAEKLRQEENIELIASENFTSTAVMEAQGSCLTNKYAEGYPGKRWYGGCENVDVVEQLAIDRAKKLFGADHANVQPHSGSQANMAVYFSVLSPGDRILTMNLAHGGHLTHGHKANFSGRFYEVMHYGVSEQDERIDYADLARVAAGFLPKMITAGASAYPRAIDFAKMREIADSVGALLFVDMAHIAGLVAAGIHANPVPYADFVTTTTHKSLRGPRAGLILCKAEFAKKIDSQVFPGIQGGPLMHVIAAKAVCLHEALQPAFKTYAAQIVSNAKALAARLAHQGYRIVSGGTDNHLMLVDLRLKKLTGLDAQELLDKAGITVNKNAIPFDTEPITKTGGIRIGTPAVTTRGMKEEEMMEIADLIHEALTSGGDLAILDRVKSNVHQLTRRFPLAAATEPACG